MSFYVKIISFFALIGIAAALMQPFQALISEAMNRIRNEFINNLENLTGMEIKYSSIRPTIFGSVDIRNLKFLNEESAFFNVSRIRINFSLAEMIFQKKTFIHTVEIERPVFNIDTVRDKEFLDLIASLANNSENGQPQPETHVSLEQISEFFPRDAHYQIRNGSFSMEDKESKVSMEDINLNIRETENKFYLEGNLSAEILYSGFSDETIVIKTEVELDGLTSDDFNGSADFIFSYINVSTLTDALFSIRSFNITANYNDHELFSERHTANNSLSYSLRYNTNNDLFFADINFNEFTLSEIITSSEHFKYAEHLFGININGYANISYDQKLNAVSYDADLKGGDIDSVTFFSPLIDAFRIKANGNNNGIDITDFHLSSSPQTARAGLFEGNAGLSGEIIFAPFTLSGTAFLDRFSFGTNESISAFFTASKNNEEISITSGEIKIAQSVINDFNVLLYPSEKNIEINASCSTESGGELYFDAVLIDNPGQFEASLSLFSLSFFDIKEFFRPFINIIDIPLLGKSYLQESLISADFFFSTDFNNIVYNAPNIVFNLGDSSGNISLSGTDRHFTLSEGLIDAGGNELNISANMVFSNPMELLFSVNASYLDLAWHISGQIFDRNTLIIHDPNGLNVYGNIADSGAVSGYFEGIDFPIPHNSRTIYLNFYSSLRYNSRNLWGFNLNHFSAVYEGEEIIRTSGTADQNGALFPEILYTDSEGTLTGKAMLDWNAGFSDIGLTLNVTDEEGKEHYYFEGGYKNNKINAAASVSEMRVNRFTGTDNLMLLTAEMTASWDSIELFNANLNLKSFDAYIEGEPMFASVEIFLSGEELLIENLHLNYSGVSASVNELILNRLEGIAKTQISINGAVRDKKLEGDIAFNAYFNAVDSWFNIRNSLRKFNGSLSLENIVFGNLSSEKMEFMFSSDNGELSVFGGLNNMLRLEMDSEGYFFLGLSAPFPIRGAVIGIYDNGNIDAQCGNFFIDMGLLYELVGSSVDFNITGGYITGSMNFIGPFWNPEFYGTGTASGMRFQSSDFITETIRAVPFNVVADGREMYFDNVTISSGSGSARASGWLHFLNWVPVSIGLDILIPEATPIPYGFNIAGFLANGTASGNLNLMFDTDNILMELSGNLYTNNAELGLNTDTLFDREEPVIKMHSVVALTVTTGSMVEFTLPYLSPIIRINPEMGTSIYVSSDTRAGEFSLNSNVNVRSGELYYFNRSFFIRQGNIIFRENESHFNPILSARAETRDRADSGPVTLSMIVDNQPLLTFEPRFEATPSLTQLEIFTILGQNLGSAQGTESADIALLASSATDVLTQIVSTSDVLSQFMFFRQFERQVRDFIGLDMFSIRTRFLHNAVISGAEGIRQQFNPQDDAIRRNLGVGNYFDNTTVFIGKYIGRDMFIQGMLTIRYDESDNMQGLIKLGGIIIEPDFGIELQSPFFNIRWDFVPVHHENWYVNDNSITISWSKSF